MRQAVNAQVLRAIGWHESRLRGNAVAHNRNGTRDLGAFQINTVHLPELARFGVGPTLLHDTCAAAHVAAWHYARQVARHGNTWRAVGAYHSGTPARAAWYANAIAGVLMRWGILPAAALPYPVAHTLAPFHTAPPSDDAADHPPITVLDAGAASPLPPTPEPPP